MLACDVKVGPEIICIDGTDGTGKTTMSTAIYDILVNELGKRVRVISPPFYDTLPGKMVWEFLHRGWGNVHDRKVLSAFYSNDRNWWLRKHFENLMYGSAEFCITNRWALSNILHNTTLHLPEAPKDGSNPRTLPIHHDTMANMPGASPTSQQGRIYHINIPANLADQLPREFILECATKAFDLGQIYALHDKYWSVKPDEENPQMPSPVWDFWVKLRLTADYIRAAMIREHANFVYDLEIAPWWVQDGPNGLYLPFANINTIVLNTLEPKLTQANVLKRCDGDATRMDMNEKSYGYQQSVSENVSWIHSHQQFIHESDSLQDILSEIHYPNMGCPYLINPINIMPIEKAKYPSYAFAFDVVNTSAMVNGMDPGDDHATMRIIQRSKISILVDIWKKTGLAQKFPDYDIYSYHFPDEE